MKKEEVWPKDAAGLNLDHDTHYEFQSLGRPGFFCVHLLSLLFLKNHRGSHLHGGQGKS